MVSWKGTRAITRRASPSFQWHAWNKDRNHSNYSQPNTVKFFLDGYCDRVVVKGPAFPNGKLPTIELSNDDYIIETWWDYCQLNGQMINQSALTIAFKIGSEED